MFCYRVPAPLVPGVPTKARLESSIQKFNPQSHLLMGFFFFSFLFFPQASGHLYERFLKIMMLSVLKNTNNPVKFWFLKNPMSPQFQHFLPYMAQKYGFEFELIQYKWPSWLNFPPTKHRQVWGYKILFLDVLFPLDLKKFVFVDADQVPYLWPAIPVFQVVSAV